MKLECLRTYETDIEIVPGQPDREWMDNHTYPRHPYKCLPMVIANTTGWEIRCPKAFSATWNGKGQVSDLIIQYDDGIPDRFASSHFADGTLTFRTGYIFRTDPGWNLWFGGPPNRFKHGIQPMTGIVETWWLPFGVTMNWKFTAPGTIRFEKDEPFCFIMPIPHNVIDGVQPEIKDINVHSEFAAEVKRWTESRAAFAQGKKTGDPEVIKEGWQKHYYRGELSDGAKAEGHINKRRLKKPKETT